MGRQPTRQGMDSALERFEQTLERAGFEGDFACDLGTQACDEARHFGAQAVLT